jgi:ribonuclease J
MYEKKNNFFLKQRNHNIKKNNDRINNRFLIEKITNKEDDSLIFIAASGVEQIGMNLNIFGYKGKFIIVDVGISFTDLGSGIMLPSTNILEEIGEENILAYVITHAHEDHIGGLCRFLKKINKPIYSTNFTMSVIEEKLKENMITNAKTITVEANNFFNIGDIEILFTGITHSIPDSNHILIRTPNGTAFHTGDWKFDEEPVLGNPPDMENLYNIGRINKISVLINDSTNAQEIKKIGTELQAQNGLRKHILDKQYKDCRITITCFSSNLARIRSLQIIAKEAGRTLVLIGRSLLKMVSVAIRLNIINEENILLDVKEASKLEAHKTMFVCTGSQGELNSVLQRSALGLHPILKLNNNDVVIFSSRVIPGNEKKISDIKNIFLNNKVKVIDHNTATEDHQVIHVSGHPGREDIVNMVKAIKPDLVIPVHGDATQLVAVANLMEKINQPCMLPEGNGTVFRIHDKEGIKILGKMETYTEVIDGKMSYPMNDEIFRQRSNLNDNGVISIILGKNKPFLLNYGAVSKREWEDNLKTSLHKFIDDYKFDNIEDFRADTSYWIFEKYGKKPILIIYLF